MAGTAVAELSRHGARVTAAPTTSLVDAVQGMTRGALSDANTNVYAPTADLPRDPMDNGPFGPLWPLMVQAINPPRADTGRPEPRVWEYPQGFNLPGGGDRLISWEVLRQASTNVDIIRRCIEIRKDDVRALKWRWTISPDALKAAQEAQPDKPRDEIEAQLRKQHAPDIARLTKMWLRPWITNGVRFGQWVAAVMEDHIALDAVAIYPVVSVGGQVIGFRIVDGSTIKLLINDLGERPQPPYPAFQQRAYGFPRGEYIADVVLNEDGTEDTSSKYTASQITYWRENFRTYTPYGFSQVEQALVSAALYLKRQGWMHAEYDEGSTPLTWLVPQGDKFTANQLSPMQRREYEQAINDDLEGQTGRRHRIKISYPGFEPTQMDSVDERYKPEYDLFLLKLVAGHLGVTLDRLGFTEAKGLGATGQHERQAEVQDDSGLNPDAAMLTDLIMELSRNYLDCPLELAFEFITEKSEDEAAKDAILAARRARGTITQNDDRKASGLTPFAIPEADMPSMVTATGIVYIEGGAEQQAAMQELAKNPPAPGGPLGGAGGGAGGSRPKPSGPAPTRPPGGPSSTRQAPKPQDKAAGGVEILAYSRWLRKNLDGVPRRPFRFSHAVPDDLAAAGHEPDGRFQEFDGYEWRTDVITKDWRAWNAAHPLHPRGPHGRFVKVGNLVDELRRIHGPMAAHHEDALDEAVRRVHAGRPFKRGQSSMADELERRGLLEEHGGAGGDKGRLQLSEAGRRHLVDRNPAAYEPESDLVAEAPSAPVEHAVPAPVATVREEPAYVPVPGETEMRAQQDRADRARAVAELAGLVEQTTGEGHTPDVVGEHATALAERHQLASLEHTAPMAAAIAGHASTAQMLDAARAQAAEHGLAPIGAVGDVVEFDPKVHSAPEWMRRELAGQGAASVQVVKPGYMWTDPQTGEQVRLSRPEVDLPRPDATPEASDGHGQVIDSSGSMTDMKLTPRQQAKLVEVRTAGEGGLVVRDMSAGIRALQRAGLVAVEQNAPITRQGGPGWNYRVTAIRTTTGEGVPSTEEEALARRARLAAIREASVAQTGQTPAQHEILGDLEARRADQAFEQATAPKPEAADTTTKLIGGQLDAFESREGAAAYLDGLALKMSELRQLAKDLGVTVGARDPKAKVIEAIVRVRVNSQAIRGGTDLSAESSRASIARDVKRQTAHWGVDRDGTADEAREMLDAATTREDAAEKLDALNLTASELHQLARDLGVTITGTKKQDIRDAIVRVRVGARLDSQAILSTPRAHDVMTAADRAAPAGDSQMSVEQAMERYELAASVLQFAMGDPEKISTRIDPAKTEAVRQRLREAGEQLDQARARAGGPAQIVLSGPQFDPSQDRIQRIRALLQTAEQMHGSDRSAWAAREQRDAAKLERELARLEGRSQQTRPKAEAEVPAPVVPGALVTSRSGRRTAGGDDVDSMIDIIRRREGSGYSVRSYLEDFTTPEKRVQIAQRLGIDKPDRLEDQELVAQIMATARPRQKGDPADHVEADAKRAAQRAASRERNTRRRAEQAQAEVLMPDAPAAPVKSGAERQLEVQEASQVRIRAQIKTLDARIDDATTDEARRTAQGERDTLAAQLAALDRQIAAARRTRRGR